MPVVVTDRSLLWNTRRKLLGNLIPAVFGVPIGVYGILEIARTFQFLGKGIWFLAASVMVMWLLVNVTSGLENPKLKRELALRLKAKGVDLGDHSVFVGFARPSFNGLLDPHEDIGFIVQEPEQVRYVGEQIDLCLTRSEIKEIRFRSNSHSMAFLGRWISIEGVSDAKPVRMLIEPRERRTMTGNRRYGRKLQQSLQEWLKKEKAQA
jgi:hypothetical protein